MHWELTENASLLGRFAPWLVGSDQCEHFYSELRAYILGMQTWDMASLSRICERFLNELFLRSDKQVKLPVVSSNKGFCRTNYIPADAAKYVQTVWPSIADIHQEYLAAVERVRPIFVALGCAEALRKAGRWHLPSLEEWASIEKAIKLQAALNEV